MRHSYPAAVRQRSDWSEILVPLPFRRPHDPIGSDRPHPRRGPKTVRKHNTEHQKCKGVDRGAPAPLQYYLLLLLFTVFIYERGLLTNTTRVATPIRS
jgi:hypothetical protein